MIEINALLAAKPEHPSLDLPGRSEIRRNVHSIGAATQMPVDSSLKPSSKPARLAYLKRMLVNFVMDVDLFIDYCLARYVVWRETHDSRKTDAR